MLNIRTTGKSKPPPPPKGPSNGRASSQGASGRQSPGGPGKPTAANTTSKIYIDTFNTSPECQKNARTVADKCGPESEEQKKTRRSKSQNPLLKHMKSPPHGGTASNPKTQWMNDHCEFLNIKPSDPQAMFEELQELPKQLAAQVANAGVEQAIEAAKAKVTHEIEERVAKILVKKGAVKVAGRALSVLTGPFAVVINVAMTAYDVYDAQKTYTEIAAEYEARFREIKALMGKLEEAKATIADAEKMLDGYKGADGTLKKQKLVSDVMYAAAELNDCIRARRCSLVAYEQTHYFDRRGAATDPDTGAGEDDDLETSKSGHKTKGSGPHTGEGCCKGQSGHHVLPNSMFKGCANYDPQKAPTICVEGTTQTHGSHGVIHKKLAAELQKLTDSNGAPAQQRQILSMEQAVQAGANSVQDAFPEAKCNKNCLVAQLNMYYQGLKCAPRSSSGIPDNGNKEKL